MARSLDNVPRHKDLPADAFFDEYVRPSRPVVLTHLEKDSPLRALSTLEKARETLGSMELTISGNFVVERARGTEPVRRTMTLAQYLAFITEHPDTRDYCYLEDPPKELAALFRAPDLSQRRDAKDTRSLIFLGNVGNYSHLHYDEDLRDVLMVQVFGRKRYVMMDPGAAHVLDPLMGPGLARTSGVCLQHMEPEEQLDFLRYVHAWDVVLEPGETLLMPLACWHYVEYVDTALSINVRMGRNPMLRSLSSLMPQPSVFMQSLCRHFTDENAITDRAREVFTKLVSLGEPSDETLHDAVLEGYDTLCKPNMKASHTLRFETLRERVVAQPR